MREREPDARFCRTEGLREALGDLGVCQPLEVREFEGLPLLGGQVRERAPHEGRALGKGRARLGAGIGGRGVVRLVQAGLVAARGPPRTQPIDRTGAREREQPRQGVAARGVEAGSLLPDLEEHVPRGLLGIGGIPEDASAHAVDGARREVVERRQGSRVAQRDPGQEPCRFGGCLRRTHGVHGQRAACIAGGIIPEVRSQDRRECAGHVRCTEAAGPWITRPERLHHGEPGGGA